MVELTEEEFSAHHIFRGPFGDFFTTERAWFSHGKRLGVICLDNFDQDWAFVMLEADCFGVYRAVDLGASYPSQAHATEKLERAMQS